MLKWYKLQPYVQEHCRDNFLLPGKHQDPRVFTLISKNWGKGHYSPDIWVTAHVCIAQILYGPLHSPGSVSTALEK